jgi:hypothetical protein
MLVVRVPARIEIAELCDLPVRNLCISGLSNLCIGYNWLYEKIRVLTCLDLTDKEFSSWYNNQKSILLESQDIISLQDGVRVTSMN